MKIDSLVASSLYFLLPYGTSAIDKEHQDQPRRERRQLTTGQKPAVDCDGPNCLLRGDGGNDKDRFRRRRQLSYVKSHSAAMYSYTEGEDAAFSNSGGKTTEAGPEEVLGATSKQAVQVGMELICEPDYAQGDNPCIDGCGHAPVPNPFNPNPVEAEKLQVPGPCKNYDCLCADSGCARSWDLSCVKWYMQCQTQTQVCGSLDDAPTAVQNINIGTGCVIAPTSANTEVCYFQELSTPAPTLVPSSSPTDICDVEVEFTCVDAETETIPCGDIETSVDLKCDCPEGAMNTLTFVYTGPDGATLDCNSGASVFSDLTSGMDVVFGMGVTEIPDSMVCSVSVAGTVIDQFDVDSSCVGNGALVLEQTFGNNGSGGPILIFDGYTCESGESHSCSEEVTYIVQICNPGFGEEVVVSVTLNITADGVVVESVDFTGSPPLGPIAGNSCIEFPHSSSINVCTEFAYEAFVDVEMVPPTTGLPCEGSSTIVFTSSGNTLPPTFRPTDFPTISPTKAPTPSPTKTPTLSPTKAPTPSPTKAPTPPPTTNTPTSFPTKTPTYSPTKAPTPTPTKTPTEPPVLVVETFPPTLAPSLLPTDICTVEVEFICVDAETETIPCGDITTPVDLKCDCPEGTMDTLTFVYTGPDGATLDCNSGAFVFTDLISGMDVVFGPTTDIPGSMVCSLSVGGTVIDQFEVDSSCVGSGALVLEQTFGNSGSGGPILIFDGYTCESGESHSCSEEIIYNIKVCNPGSGEEVVTSVTLNITADGIVVESVDFTGSPPLGPLAGNACVEFFHSSSINICTEFVYNAVLDVEMVPPTSGLPCEGSSTIVFTSSGNTLPPTFPPTDFPTKAETPSPTKAPTEPPVTIVETIRPTFGPTDFPTKAPTPSPTPAPTEPPVTIVETPPPMPVAPPGDDDDDDDDDDDAGKDGKGFEGKGGKKTSGKGGKKTSGKGGKKGGYDYDFAKKGGYYGANGKKGAYAGGKGGGIAKPSKPTVLYPSHPGPMPSTPSKPGPSKPLSVPTGPSKPVPVPTGPSKPVSMPSVRSKPVPTPLSSY